MNVIKWVICGAIGAELADADLGEFKQRMFQQSFSPFDFLWFGLAALTAYRVGSGTANNES